MQHGIYYAYWEKEWNGDYLYYTKKVAELGFDVLEVAASPLLYFSDTQILELKACAEYNGIRLTAGHGPTAVQNIASPDPDIRNNALQFFTHLLRKMERLGINLIGGALYSY